MFRLWMGIPLLVGLSCFAVAAEGPKPFAEFSAKRIKAPKAGSRPKISVQIDPVEQAAVLAPPKAKAPQAASAPESSAQAQGAPGSYDWFWERIPPDAAKSGPGRLDLALSTLAGAAGKVPAPRLQQMQDIAKGHGIDILRATLQTQVSPALVLAVISVESAGKVDALSSAGAQGLMQLMPATAERFGVEDSFASSQNITGGVKYLDFLMGEFDRDPILVLAGYNAGEGSVRKYAGVPPFAETRDYVPKVLAAFQVAKGLCKTPPELISDGCVFAGMK